MIVPKPPAARITESQGRQALWDYFPARSNDCPGYMWVLDLAYGTLVAKPWICGSVQHLADHCGPSYVQTHIDKINGFFHMRRWVEGMLVPTMAIHFTATDYDPAILNRLNQRRYQHGGGMVVVRRGRDGGRGKPTRLHVYADRAVSGTKTPSVDDWEQMAPGVAIEQVAARSLLLPGVFSSKGGTPVTYSGTWADRTIQREDLEQRTLLLGLSRSRKIFSAAERVMEAITNLHLGIQLGRSGETFNYRMIPQAHQDWWVTTTRDVVRRLNSGQTEEGVVNWWLRGNALGMGNTDAFVLR